jgi:hypothetical protein
MIVERPPKLDERLGEIELAGLCLLDRTGFLVGIRNDRD